MTSRTQPLPPRHVPQRTCVGCRTQQAKRELVRIVRTPAGQVAVDPTGRLAGRGAYLHRDPECWAEGLRKGRLARALHTTISSEDQETISVILRSEGRGAGMGERPKNLRDDGVADSDGRGDSSRSLP